jgi:hypothetical protein
METQPTCGRGLKFVSLEQELLGLLQKRVEEDRQMLVAVGGRS